MTTPIAAVKAGFRNYIRFNGRATRPEFWWWMLFITVANILLGIIDRIIERAVGIEDLTLLGSIFGLATLLPGLAVACRRLHDIGKSGWWLLIWHLVFVIPGAAAVITFVILALAFAKSASWAAIFADLLLAFLAFIVAVAVSLGLLIWAVIWLARQGEPGANRYGPDPRAADADTPPAYPGQNDWYTEPPR